MRDIKSVLERALQCAALSSTVLVMGCGDTIDLDGFELAPCNHGLDDLNPAIEVDYVALMSTYGVSSSTGTACASATDKQTCEEALMAAVDGPSVYRTVVATYGDTVDTWATNEDLMAFLGSVDTEGEAVLVAWQAGYEVGCDDLERGAVKVVGDDFEVIATKMVQDCTPIVVNQYRLRVSASGVLTELESVEFDRDENVCVGRRPAGLNGGFEPCDDDPASFWTEIAYLEASAVEAFNGLAAELFAFGAPDGLVEGAFAAALDETRHARATKEIALRLGGEAIHPKIDPTPHRTLEEFALENATEGCVRETFGAFFGAWQARNAKDPAIARAMRTISEDETRHSELSWRIAEWLKTQLDSDALARIDKAQRHATLVLKRACRRPVPLSLVVGSGVPTPSQSLAMWEVLDERLWA